MSRYRLCIIGALAVFLFMPPAVHAVDPHCGNPPCIVPGTGANGQTPIYYNQLSSKLTLAPPGFWGPLLVCNGNYSATSTNEAHCVSACDAIIEFEAIIYFVLTIVLYIGAPAMFVAGGVMILFGGASPNMLSQGKKVLWGAAIGVVLAVSAFVIVSTFLWLIQPKSDPTGKTGVAWPNIQCQPLDTNGKPLVPGGELHFNYDLPSSTAPATSNRSTSNSPVSSGCYTNNGGPGATWQCASNGSCNGISCSNQTCQRYPKADCQP